MWAGQYTHRAFVVSHSTPEQGLQVSAASLLISAAKAASAG